MKSFKQYLSESKKTYTFKVKIAGDCPKGCSEKIKHALSEFDATSISSKRTPISVKHSEFPEQKNVSMEVFTVTTTYPATSKQVHDRVVDELAISPSIVKVCNEKEEEEYSINHQHDELSGKALLDSDYEASDNQDLVGEKHKLSFLKSLSSKTLEQYTGVNDELLAKSVPKESGKVNKLAKAMNVTSPVGTKKVKLTPVAAGTHNSLNVAAKGK